MADRGFGIHSRAAFSATPAPGRHSTRKRKEVESYANEWQSSGDHVKLQTQPPRKRKKLSPANLENESLAFSKPLTQPNQGKGKNVAHAPPSAKSKKKTDQNIQVDEEKRLKRYTSCSTVSRLVPMLPTDTSLRCPNHFR
jgi:hypothetical protein